MKGPADPGSAHLVWIGRFQLLLLGAGMPLWAIRGWRASLVFSISGFASLLFWLLHRWVVARMLDPSVRKRWVYGLLSLLKLALIALLLRGMMVFFPAEVLPLATGVLIFVGGILLEAIRLVVRPESQ
jgi:hypothetical protein